MINFYEKYSKILISEDPKINMIKNPMLNQKDRLNHLVLLKYFINSQYVLHNNIPFSHGGTYDSSPEVQYLRLHHKEVAKFLANKSSKKLSFTRNEIINLTHEINNYAIDQFNHYLEVPDSKYIDDYSFLLICYISFYNSKEPLCIDIQNNNEKECDLLDIFKTIERIISKPVACKKNKVSQRRLYADYIIPLLYLRFSDLILIDTYNKLMYNFLPEHNKSMSISKIETLLLDLTGNIEIGNKDFIISSPTAPGLYFNSILRKYHSDDRIKELLGEISDSITNPDNNLSPPKNSSYSCAFVTKFLLKSLMESLNPNNYLLMPSILTIFINSIIPHELGHVPISILTDSYYSQLNNQFISYIQVPELKRKGKTKPLFFISDKNKQHFLKMLLISDYPKRYQKNGTSVIDELFLNEEWKMIVSVYSDLYKHTISPYVIKEYKNWYISSHTINCPAISIDDVLFYYIYLKPHIKEKNYNIKRLINDYEKNPGNYQLSQKSYDTICSLYEQNMPDTTEKLTSKLLLDKISEYSEKCSANYIFRISYDFFRIFRKLTILFKKPPASYKDIPKCDVDIALSLLHLNQFTEWMNAMLIVYKLPEEYNSHNELFYTKLYLCNHPYLDSLGIPTCDLTTINNRVKEKFYKRNSQLNNKKTIKSRLDSAWKGFYSYSNEILNRNNLLSIFKNTGTNNPCRNNYVYHRIKDLEDNASSKITKIEPANDDIAVSCFSDSSILL